MTLSLDDVYVASCLQMLEGLQSLVDKAEAHCEEHGIDPAEILQARLAEDMWPFAKQVTEASHHSARAVPTLHKGVFTPELDPVPESFALLKADLAESIAKLRAVPAGSLDAIADQDMRFEFRDFRLDFTVRDFLLSFSLPNFYFHVTTAYAILRGRGLPVGKMNYLGPLRLKA